MDTFSGFPYSLTMLVAALVTVIPMIVSSRWNAELIRRSRAARQRNDAALVRRLTTIRAADFAIDGIQFGLWLTVVLMKPSAGQWTVMGAVFVASVAARLLITRWKRQILEGAEQQDETKPGAPGRA